jgi:hypothetical protein
VLERELEAYDLNPVNLGKSNWNYKSPLRPIKDMMETCVGAVIIGLERHHSLIGYEKENSKDSKEIIHKYSSSPWIQIEAGIAYQAGLPLLILKEDKVYSEGILDPQISDYFVFDFTLKKMSKQLSPELKQSILSWVSDLKKT